MTDFGKDTYCLDSLQTGVWVTGAQLVGQRFYRALLTPRGALRGSPEHEDWGEDLTELIGSSGGKDSEREIRAKVARAASKDEQIESVAVSIVTDEQSNGSVTQTVSIEAQTAAGPFTLVLKIGDVTVELLGLTT